MFMMARPRVVKVRGSGCIMIWRIGADALHVTVAVLHPLVVGEGGRVVIEELEAVNAASPATTIVSKEDIIK